jgi:hypothetical protein
VVIALINTTFANKPTTVVGGCFSEESSRAGLTSITDIPFLANTDIVGAAVSSNCVVVIVATAGVACI